MGTRPAAAHSSLLPCIFCSPAYALVQVEILLRRTGGQGGLHVVGHRGLKGEQGWLAGVRRGRGLAFSEKVLTGAAELRWRRAGAVTGRGHVSQGVCETKEGAL